MSEVLGEPGHHFSYEAPICGCDEWKSSLHGRWNRPTPLAHVENGEFVRLNRLARGRAKNNCCTRRVIGIDIPTIARASGARSVRCLPNQPRLSWLIPNDVFLVNDIDRRRVWSFPGRRLWNRDGARYCRGSHPARGPHFSDPVRSPCGWLPGLTRFHRKPLSIW
jgi:hypothetical protein